MKKLSLLCRNKKNQQMQESLISLILLLAPALLLLYALAIVAKGGNKGFQFKRIPEYLGALGIITSVIAAGIVVQYQVVQTGILGVGGLGFALRLDTLSVSMFAMIAVLGFVVLKFSRNYMDGDPRKELFMARLATTIASVELLVLSGNMGQLLVFWFIISLCLHHLLVFYKNRPQAIAAARKKFIFARLGDASLLLATLLIYRSFGTGNLQEIFAAVQEGGMADPSLTWAGVLLVITAVLKSAQFPTHGWLIKVVETPTPVSALLHAGLLNAGPFLIVRMSFLMAESTTASLLLILIAGFTAMFASIVYLTQPSIKVALGYSSIAHMGFSLLICGFGVYSAAILHVVAHSFYKAHSFLSSGSVIDSVRSHKIKVPKRLGNPLRIGMGILASLGIYALFCYLWGINPSEDFSLMAVGAVIVMGLSQVIASTLDSKGSLMAILQSSLLAFFVAFSFFSFEYLSRLLLGSQIPTYTEPVFAIKAAAVGVLGIFSAVVFLQLFASRLNKNWGYELGVHLRNGLYANILFDRLIGSLKHSNGPSSP